MAVGRVAVVGSLNMDLVVRATRLPDAGETVAGETFAQYPGGKGLNQAVAARRCGAAVRMFGRVGDDAFGTALRGLLAEESIDHGGVRRDPAAGTGIAAIVVQPDGENRIISVPRANGALCAEDIDAAAAMLAGTDVLLLQGEVALAASLRAAQAVRATGGRVVFSPAPVPPPSAELSTLLAQSDVVLVNRREAAALGGHDALAARGGGALIVTLGADGAMLSGHGAEPRRLPARPVSVVDTTAAGDALAGALAAELAAGQELLAALRWGMAAGALACTRAGAIPSLPQRSAIAALIARDPPPPGLPVHRA